MVLLETHDRTFAVTVSKTLGQWGFVACQPGSDDTGGWPGQGGAVALLDIRELGEEAFSRSRAIRQRYPGVEVVLINRPDNVVASIAGMQAGAFDEIIVPCDTGTLQAIVTEAYTQSEANRGVKGKKSILTRFSEAMMAATFAQAGDFAGALDMLDERPTRRTDRSGPKRKNDGE